MSQAPSEPSNRFSRYHLALRFVLLVLIAGLLLAWLRIGPQRALPGSLAQAAAACGTYASRATEVLVPTPPAGETLLEAPEYVRRIVAAEPQATPEPYSLRWRVGVGLGEESPYYFRWPVPRPGWYLNWTTDPGTQDGEPYPLGMEFLPMVRLRDNRLSPDVGQLMELAAAHPGRTWLIGNEPDVRWQDDATPEEYACFYHVAHRAITTADPSSRVAIGGISQVTPLRLAYLDRIWASYQTQFGAEMPVDVWTMHAFVLREEADNWGVGTPPGFEDVEQGVLWDIEQHTDLRLVENQVRLMRRWMQEQGQRDKPLYITEYGVLMPAAYGFPPSRVIEFMVGSFDLFRTLRDAEMGYAADDGRLVQRWTWYSTRSPLYPSGDLFDANGDILPPMRALSGYLRAHGEP